MSLYNVLSLPIAKMQVFVLTPMFDDPFPPDFPIFEKEISS
jgi:hypothetical protein